MGTHKQFTPRSLGIVGSKSSGKTSLLEAMLHHAGMIDRQGSSKDGNFVGDGSKESRNRQMSCEPNFAYMDYLGDDWSIADCPGSIELLQDSLFITRAMDIVVVVAEPDPNKTVALIPIIRHLQDNKIPHMIFINKLDNAENSVKATFDSLQAISALPLLLREIPIRENGQITGLVDLISERCWKFNEGDISSLTSLPNDLTDRQEFDRQEMMEALSDFDDELMETLLEEATPATETLYKDLTETLSSAQTVPVFFGSAEKGWGVTRLMKALRHESPDSAVTEERLDISEKALIIAKNLYTAQGKLSIARVLGDDLKEGDSYGEVKCGSLNRLFGQKAEKAVVAKRGSLIALGRLDDIKAGQVLLQSAIVEPRSEDILTPQYSLAVSVENKGDEVKLTNALSKLVDEDPSLLWEGNHEVQQIVLRGQGDAHLNIAFERMKNKFGVAVTSEKEKVAYKETIKKSIQQRGRHKKQSGGSGQFGDVVLEIKPIARQAGFEFTQTIHGGSVPKQYIPAVEDGVKEYMQKGPLGFPVVDIAVNLSDGQYHDVDSSELAFKLAGIVTMKEAMPQCDPVLLEPIMHVKIHVPSEFSSKIQPIVSSRRGQLLGFAPMEDKQGFDEVSALMPQAVMGDIINEIRSVTLGVGSYTAKFEKMQELRGPEADQVIQSVQKAHA